MLTDDPLSVSHALGPPWASDWRPAPASVGAGEVEVGCESRVGPTMRQDVPVVTP